MSETLFIVNPVCGGKRGLRRWRAFEKSLRRRSYEFRVAFTSARGQALELSRSSVREGATEIVAFGGDGTLNEVLNGFMSAPGCAQRTARLGYVPAGSSNDFLRSIGAANGTFAEDCREGDPLALDVGKIECRDRSGAMIERYFLVNASVGVVPQALEFFNRQTLMNKIFKRISLDLTVVASGLSSILRHKTASYELRFDREEALEGKFTNLAVLRGIWFGGGMSYGKRGIPEPGKFSVVGIKNLSIAGRALMMPRFYTGRILEHPAVWKRTCSELEVSSNSTGIVEADGEIVGYLPARFSVLPKSLEMVVWKEDHEK